MYRILICPGGYEGMYFEDKPFNSAVDALEYAMHNNTMTFHIVKIITFLEGD